MIVLGGSSSLKLAEEVSRALGATFVEPLVKRFPDGEGYVRVEGVGEGDRILLIQSTSPPQDANLIELFFLMDALEDLGAEITVLLPYFGYGRQDRAFAKGEAVSSRAIAKHISLTAKSFITVNPHKEYILDYFKIPARSLDAGPLIGEHFSSQGLDCPVVVAPDSGSMELARKVSSILGCRCEHCRKKRLGPGRVVTSAQDVTLNGEDVIIVDDIIDSGGTIVEAAKALKSQGAGPIRVACIHPVLTGNAANRILEIADELIATNTIETEYSKISVAGLIAEAIEQR